MTHAALFARNYSELFWPTLLFPTSGIPMHPAPLSIHGPGDPQHPPCSCLQNPNNPGKIPLWQLHQEKNRAPLFSVSIQQLKRAGNLGHLLYPLYLLLFINFGKQPLKLFPAPLSHVNHSKVLCFCLPRKKKKEKTAKHSVVRSKIFFFSLHSNLATPWSSPFPKSLETEEAVPACGCTQAAKATAECCFPVPSYCFVSSLQHPRGHRSAQGITPLPESFPSADSAPAPGMMEKALCSQGVMPHLGNSR